MTQAAIYLRVSTEEQAAGGYGLDAQHTQCAAMALVKGWDVAHVLRDEGLSGAKSEERRPALAELLELACSGQVQAVIVGSLDRLGRDTRLILRLIDELNQCGVDIVSCRESIDTTTATGQFVLTVFAGLAQLERDTITERLTNGRNARGLVDGERGGRVPMGYKRVMRDGKATGEIVIHAAEARLVRDIFTQRTDGATLQQIADNLNERGIQTRRGGSWSPSSLHYVLGNEEKYRGGQRWRSEAHWPVILEEE